MFESDARFSEITEKITDKHDVLLAVHYGRFKDTKSSKYLPLDEEGFSESIDKFLEDTGNIR